MTGHLARLLNTFDKHMIYFSKAYPFAIKKHETLPLGLWGLPEERPPEDTSNFRKLINCFSNLEAMGKGYR